MKTQYNINRRRHTRLISRSTKNLKTINSLITQQQASLVHWEGLIKKYNTPFQIKEKLKCEECIAWLTETENMIKTYTYSLRDEINPLKLGYFNLQHNVDAAIAILERINSLDTSNRAKWTKLEAKLVQASYN